MRMLFEAAVSFTRRGAARYTALASALLRGAPLLWILSLAAALLFFLLPQFAGLRRTFFGVSSFFLWLSVLSLAGLVAVIARKLARLPQVGFGLCSGMPHSANGHPALTQWFHGFLSQLSGKPPEQPLTFGDLQEKEIQLRMISTCLTHRRPYGLPIDAKNFYFRENEFREYFPAAVVDWMVSHPAPEAHPRDANEVATAGYCRLPQPSDMPVLVAARMSLSFPLLFRAVPLYSIDYTLRRKKEDEPPAPSVPGGALNYGEPRKPECCWFLDGGICSNFPVYMFDAPLPRWPTFGIDLQAARRDRPDSAVWMPERNEEGLGELWDRIPAQPSLTSIGQYVAGIIDAARNWTENRQMTVPGYRDRIVHIRLDESKEGGLSLDMPPELVQSVSDRGRAAGELLLEHFADPAPGITLTWDNHRWIRLRSFLGRLEETLMEFQHGFLYQEPGDRGYSQLLDRGRADPPDSYRLTGRQRTFLEEWVARLLEIAGQSLAAPEDERATQGEPRPTPVMRLMPRTVPKAGVDDRGTPMIEPQNEGARAVGDVVAGD